ncbi:single-stranded DNA-binding protein [Promicromonospora sp. AC04]|uniref:single-stranded DNA-binding protein n=1 Tax=Promicromonospora sp. AC04 TaxID=2135723 RepID=UPI000D44561D|nr:single-stranded DNA-binding protein [Promicromonospora sp. AC04]PUB20901.1 single-stranded DNA-binding protein [Promicromonospora sp. AC04]
MTIPIRQSLEGVFLTGLRPGTTRTGIPVLRATVRVQRWRHEQDETFTAQEPVTCDLVVFHEGTQRARTRFRPGDAFVASGHVNTYDAQRDGKTVQCHEFVARRIGHDAARTRYKVTRTRRRLRPTSPAAALAGSGTRAPRTGAGQAS